MATGGGVWRVGRRRTHRGRRQARIGPHPTSRAQGEGGGEADRPDLWATRAGGVVHGQRARGAGSHQAGNAPGPLVAARGAPVILMHNRSRPSAVVVDRLGGSYLGPDYDDFLEDVASEMLGLAQGALAAGIPRDQIILDPGIGFGKRVMDNYEIIGRLNELSSLACPILIGPSKKSFMQKVLQLKPDQIMAGTAAAVALSITNGAHIVRVHDIKEMVQVCRIADLIDGKMSL